MALGRAVRASGLMRAVALCVAVVACAWPAEAVAHPQDATAIQLDIGNRSVEGDVQIPLPQVEAAGGKSLRGESLRAYVARHLQARGADGTGWTVRAGAPTTGQVQGVENLIVPIVLRPPAGHEVGDFDLFYDGILEAVATHKVFVIVRTHWDRGVFSRDAKTAGVITSRTDNRLRVHADGGSWAEGLAAVMGLGVEHIVEGADHMLFLLMLLLVAPLVAVNGRWRPAGSAWTSLRRVVHIVTAFAVGHSVTLGLAAAGVVDVPARPVEIFIAVSVGVTAVHAIRPLVYGREAFLAASFGLVHGLAFAALIGDIGLDRASLVSSLLGFNLGIEMAQLIIVGAAIPSLYLLSRTPVYPVVRVAGALFGLAAATGWFVERVTESVANPLEPAMTALTEHGLLIAAALAILAAVTVLVARDDQARSAGP
jgi:HupE/UreJ protein